MGQTLSNGVYLPNEGERNCYAGLASNWQILNTAVGNIAEKAPLVHTHGNITNDGKVGTAANKPLITGTGGVVQAGSFGNAANTFCEGNDSRLSDARTPVAHTHTKSDITDLLNSNFIPSANNSYDLGSSANQWNNLYAKNYYYNGVAWGLNVKNTWTNFNVINGYRFEIRQTSQEIGVIPSSNQWNGFYFVDKNESSTVAFEHAFMSSGETRFKINMVDNYASHNSDSTVWIEFLRLYTSPDSSAFCIGADARPLINNTYNLGTSTNKWKTLNGVNPGALSLPNIGYTEDNPDVYNVGTDINNLTKNVNDPLHFSWTAPFDGWLSIMWYLRNITPPFNIFITSHSDAKYSKFSQTWSASSARWYLATTFPVVKNVTYFFDVDFQNTTIGVVHHAYLLPCLGNV